jgi:subtilase family serine protease
MTPGPYYVVAFADDDQEVAETDETNNSLSGGSIEITRSDLAMSSVSGPATAGAAETISVSNMVQNLGAGEATAFRVGIYLSADAVIDGGDTLLGDRQVSTLGAGVSDSASTGVTIPASTATGTYFLGAIADHQNAVPESDEGNNALAGNAVDVVNDLPDLIVTELTAPSSVNSGSLLSGYVQVQNVGGSSTVVGGEIAMYLSEDTVIDGSDLYLGTVPFPELSAGQIDTLSYRLGVPYDTPRGRYWVVAEVDSGDDVVESDETNNTGTAASQTRVK